MKKNTKIGLGLALVSAVALAAAFPVFADVKPKYIERTGTEALTNSVIEIEAKSTSNETNETVVTENGAGEKENSVKAPDFEKSPNFCRIDYDPNLADKESPEAKPSDYKDEALRKLAEEYKAKGYFLTDCKYEATKHASGLGGSSYVFCNGFTAVDDNKGNNKVFIEAVKCTQTEFDWYIKQFGEGAVSVSRYGNIEKRTMENNFVTESISYHPDTEIMLVQINFKPYSVQNGVG